MGDIILKARYLIPTPDEIIEDGAVVVDGCGGTIRSVSSFDALSGDQKRVAVDFDNAVILPGLVNAHCHLELSDLHGLVSADGGFVAWIDRLMKARSEWGRSDYIRSVENGIRMSLESGVTTIADITSMGHAIAPLLRSAVRKVIFAEMIGRDPSMANEAIEKAMALISDVSPDDHNLVMSGISPHAPYSTSFELYKACADATGLPLCTHIAESREEAEFLEDGSGAFAVFLGRLGILSPAWRPPCVSPVRYLQRTGILETSPLLVHCNYVSCEEISMIKRSGSSVVFCPRSHNYFGRTNHPVCRLLDAGVNVAIGTDSLASNDSLSVLDEMKFLFANVPGLSSESIMAMGTVNGALSLGLGGVIGRLAAGHRADISVVGLPAAEPCGNYDRNGACAAVLNAGSENIYTMVDGMTCYDSGRGSKVMTQVSG